MMGRPFGFERDIWLCEAVELPGATTGNEEDGARWEGGTG